MKTIIECRGNSFQVTRDNGKWSIFPLVQNSILEMKLRCLAAKKETSSDGKVIVKHRGMEYDAFVVTIGKDDVTIEPMPFCSREVIKILDSVVAQIYKENKNMASCNPNNQSSIPNHLLHGHDGDPVIHAPVVRKATDASTLPPSGAPDFQAELDFIRGDKVDDPESIVTTASTGEPVEVTIPESTKVEDKPMTYPVKHEQVYRTAALALSKLDLTAVIKAQRIIFPESEYWKEITRAKLYEVLMEELMKTCDWEVGMIDQGNGPFLDNHPRMLCAGIEKYPFIISTHLSTEPGSGSSKHKYQYTIAYRPIGVTAEAEV